MTTSEFLASLQERPPTYNESEQIQSNTRPAGDQSTSEGGGGNSDNPPVNPGQQGSARTTSSSEGEGGAGRSNGGTSSSRRHDSASKTHVANVLVQVSTCMLGDTPSAAMIYIPVLI